ncbi:MAG: class I SAM-dependent methyltransferase [Rhodospirillaceae bacterium]|nr:class I SAM-dependent methyltransferase [Rhodospirillaceae bacterium]
MFPQDIYDTPGQIVPAERELYYALARDEYQGLGEIVELGALFGASAVCFGAGLRDNPRVLRKSKRIHAYDLFEIYPEILSYFPDGAVGQSFRHVFHMHTAPYRDLIDVTACNVRNVPWDGRPIEILFIDAEKSAQGYEAIMQTLYPFLIPGLSKIVDQDFYYQGAWWLPVKNELLSEFVEPGVSADCTLVTQVLQEFPAARLETRMEELSSDRKLALMTSQAERIGGEYGALVDIQRAHVLFMDGRRDAAIALIDAVMAQFDTAVVRFRINEIRAAFGLPSVKWKTPPAPGATRSPAASR